jgi:hypothetical protein
MANQFIALSDRVSVRADEIAGIYIDHGDHLMVKTRDGEIFQADPGYGQGVWEAKRRLLQQVEDALKISPAGGAHAE